MKKTLLSVALLSLFAVGTVSAQDQDKKRKAEEAQKTEQSVEMKTDQLKNENPELNQQKLSNEEQKAKEEQQKQYDPNQQPVQNQQEQPAQDSSVPK